MNSRSRVEAQASSADAFNPLIYAVRQQFPLITNQESARPYYDGDLHHASFRIRPNSQPKGITKEVLAEALRRAGDPDNIAFSRHGASGHTTYNESLQLLQDALEGDSLSLRTQAMFAPTRDGRQIPSQRILVVAPERERVSFVPHLQVQANEVLQHARATASPRGVLNKAIESTANQSGIGPALVQAIYQDMHPSDLERIFADRSKRLGPSHHPGVLPHPKMTPPQRAEYYGVARQVNDALTVRVDGKVQTRIDPGAHNHALEILGNNGWLGPYEQLKDIIGFEPTERRVTPLAVLLTPHEVAARAANTDHDPYYLQNTLDRLLGDQATTRIITSYLKH
jgi:hypothetical protein